MSQNHGTASWSGYRSCCSESEISRGNLFAMFFPSNCLCQYNGKGARVHYLDRLSLDVESTRFFNSNRQLVECLFVAFVIRKVQTIETEKK